MSNQRSSPRGIATPSGSGRLAEEKGITAANVEEMARSGDREIRRVPGEEGFGRPLGLDDNWVFNITKQLGNYGEIWHRNLGDGSPMKRARGRSALWRDGGLMFSAPWD